MIPAPLVIAGVIAAAAIVRKVASRASTNSRAATEDAVPQQHDDELVGLFTLPPFVDLPAPGHLTDSATPRRVDVQDLSRFWVRGSKALACTLETFAGGSLEGVAYQVVALHTRQQLPRTMIRAGIDVYSLPAYEGMVRLREPAPTLRRGVMAIVTTAPTEAAGLPFDSLASDLSLDPQLTVALDGDWLYAYRGGPLQRWRIEPILLTLQRFARAVENPPWPRADETRPYIYGQVT
jgi:hypothetical protein